MTQDSPTAEDRLKALGLVLPPARSPGGTSTPVRRDGDLLYVSGQRPHRPDGTRYTDKVGTNVTVAEAYPHARLTGLEILAALKAETGSLENIRFLKIFGMVNAAPEFCDHPQVINGCSDLLGEVLEERGRHARSAIGMGSLPGNMTVEIEAVVRVISA
jgi:enamine deaminase RidA (YjgF/YER057c/UK114 family)